MPFLEYTEVKPLFDKGLQTFFEANTDTFDYFENVAAKVVRDEAGITIPTLVDDAPEWIALPMVQIMRKLLVASKRITNYSEYDLKQYDKEYLDAIDFCRRKHLAGDTHAIVSSASATGEVSDVVRW